MRKSIPRKMFTTLLSEINKTLIQMQNTLRSKAIKAAHIRQANQFEKEVTEQLTSFFDLQISGAVEKVTVVLDDSEEWAKQLLDVDEQTKELINIMVPLYAKWAGKAAVSQLLAVGINVLRSGRDPQKSTASEWLESMGTTLPPGISAEMPAWMVAAISVLLEETFTQPYWQKISETTRDDIQQILDTGLSEGWSAATIASEISRRHPTQYSRKRGMLVARTESGHALNGAREISLRKMREELPDDLANRISKSWISVLGNTTRDSHADLDGSFENKDGMFNLDGVLVPWPAHVALPPKNRCNCRCTIGIEMGVSQDQLTDIEGVLRD